MENLVGGNVTDFELYRLDPFPVLPTSPVEMKPHHSASGLLGQPQAPAAMPLPVTNGRNPSALSAQISSFFPNLLSAKVFHHNTKLINIDKQMIYFKGNILRGILTMTNSVITLIIFCSF